MIIHPSAKLKTSRLAVEKRSSSPELKKEMRSVFRSLENAQKGPLKL